MYEEKECNSFQIGDFFYSPPRRNYGMSSMAGLGYIQPQCRSRCIQEGEKCPIYDSCNEKYNLGRDILDP